MRSYRSAFPFALVVLMAFLLPFGLWAEPRVALVIGNGKYQYNNVLKNPANDARDMAAALSQAGFDVVIRTDAGLDDMNKALREFGNKLKAQKGVGLFYYTGHGTQVGGKSYLLPVDQDIEDADEVAYKAMDAEAVLAKMQSAGNSLNLVFLDACRNNPFPGSGRSGERGLAVVKVDLPESVIVYAAEPGKTAADGEGRNSPFTRALLKNMTAQGTDILALMKKVKAEVASATDGQQSPRVDQNLSRDFAFYPAGVQAAIAPTAAPAVAAEAAAATPKVSVMKSYGSFAVSASSAGALYLDGAKVADLGSGDEAKIDSVAAGDRALELRYADGQVETKSASVQKGKSASVSFSYRLAPRKSATPAVGGLPANFVLVPSGTFTMGSPKGEKDRGYDEAQHQVSLSPFAISKYDVTFDEYDEYCVATGTAKPGDNGWGRGSRPVINVSWYDAVAYCNWRSQQEGKTPAYTISGTNVSCDFGTNGYRLPTEAEWEYAAKGGPQAASLVLNAVYAGNPNIDQVAWYSSNTLSGTHPVGQKAPNSLGLYDMAGNVWQWCWDRYGDYPKATQSDPVGASSDNLNIRVLRGGGWGSAARDIRSANRVSKIPDYRDYYFGFRLASRP